LIQEEKIDINRIGNILKSKEEKGQKTPNENAISLEGSKR